jgi:HAD superfamily hydrolase (TIGR01490 family)
VSLAIFDLDNTLIAGDSDYLWGQFLVEEGIVDGDEYEKANERFYEQYREGSLNIVEFLAFALKPLSQHPAEKLFALRDQFIEAKIKPILLSAARDLINQHKQAGDLALVITATNRFVTEPIVSLYGIEHLIATTPTMQGGRFTGQFEGTPCFQEGKITRLNQWLNKNSQNLQGSWFYSDSLNDVPLLSTVSNPVAVDPDEKLREIAQQRGWPVISLRN